MKALVLSTNNYRSFPSRKQRFAGRLVERGYDVLYVEAPVTWLAAARPKQWRKLVAGLSGTHKQAEGLWTVSPTPWLPYFKKYESIADHDSLTYLKYLRGLAGDWTHDVGIVLSYLPFVPTTLQLLGAPVVYDCVDDHSAYPGLVDKATVDRLEARTADIASAVIATNESIAAKFSTHEDKLSLIQNGVDHELFAAPARAWLDTLTTLPREHKMLYAGAMREWFDVQTLGMVAAAYPEWSLDCFGDALPAVRRQLSAHANILFKGTLSQAAIAQLAPQYDVALIPFTESPLTVGVDPLKFYEYVAAGLPVVSSSIDALGVFGEDMVRLASTPGEFIAAIRDSFDTDSLDLRRHRVESSRRFDWSFRIAEFDRVLDAMLTQDES
ncbi:MAG TPA: glycosyltransferase [Clostridia bacterium]|nr:glycosyltransferase [Clostridia bacterium]